MAESAQLFHHGLRFSGSDGRILVLQGSMTERYRGYHDVGGRPAGPISRDEFEFADWQKLSEAIRGALDAKGRFVTLDEVRRAFESFGATQYDKLGFYERRVEALAMLLDEKKILAREVVEARMDSIAMMECHAVDHAARTVEPAKSGKS